MIFDFSTAYRIFNLYKGLSFLNIKDIGLNEKPMICNSVLKNILYTTFLSKNLPENILPFCSLKNIDTRRKKVILINRAVKNMLTNGIKCGLIITLRKPGHSHQVLFYIFIDLRKRQGLS